MKWISLKHNSKQINPGVCSRESLTHIQKKINFVFECSQFGENSFTNVHLNKGQDHFSSLCIGNQTFFLLGNQNASNIAQYSHVLYVDSFDNSNSSWPKTEDACFIHPCQKDAADSQILQYVPQPFRITVQRCSRWHAITVSI